MLKLTIWQVLLRVIPETFLLILGTYFLYKKAVNKKLCVISTIIFSIIVYLVRMLPIHYGVHAMINIIFFTMISILINKIPVIKAMTYCLILTITLGICEFLNLFIFNKLLKINSNILNNSLGSILYFYPSLMLFACVVLLIYVFMHKKKEGLSSVFN